MKFLLIGCNGKMGKSVCSIAKELGDEIVVGLDVTNSNTGFPIYQNITDVTEGFDAIIDFSTAQNHSEFINLAINKKVPFGLFSTIISKQDQNALAKAEIAIPLLVCKNASIGVNILYDLLEKCSKALPACDCAISEYHHKNKLDSPSGTAKQIQKILSGKFSIQINCFRVGEEKGFHKIEFFLDGETISISHKANSREIFSRGAILAMHSLCNLPAGKYDIKKLLQKQ